MQAEVIEAGEGAESLQDEPFYEFSTYPFDGDTAFQEGLRSIVSAVQGKSPEELDDIIGRAKTFYFARMTGRKVTWENYLEWKKSHPAQDLFPNTPSDLPAPATGSESTTVDDTGNAGTLSFQQIAELIQTGQTHLIPNNKVIPNILHTATPTQSVQAARKKPWERDGNDALKELTS